MVRQMTQSEAREILEKWIDAKKYSSCGSFKLPEADEVVYSKFEGNTLIEYTFRYLLKTAYPKI